MYVGPSPQDPPTPPPGGPPTPPPSSRCEDALALRRSPKPCRSDRRPRAALLAENLGVPENPLIAPTWRTVSHAFPSTASRCAARQKSGPSPKTSVYSNSGNCKSGDQFDGLALRRSRFWMYLIRACTQVLRMFVVGMRRKSGPSRNPFVCQYSPCARPDPGRPIGGLHIQTDRHKWPTESFK